MGNYKINFFLTYYDRRSPSILIHADSAEAGTPPIQAVRYFTGSFPTKISAPSLDENLLSFWTTASSNAGNEILRFMLYYRIIEYAAFHYMENSKRQQITRILMDPALYGNVDSSVSKIAAVMSGGQIEEYQRVEKLLSAVVSSDLIWHEIEANRASFQSDVALDGDFVIPALITDKDSIETFRNGGISRAARALKNIRNCLSHGRDQSSSGVILPTVRNLRALRAWVHIAAKAAGEVVIYKDAP